MRTLLAVGAIVASLPVAAIACVSGPFGPDGDGIDAGRCGASSSNGGGGSWGWGWGYGAGYGGSFARDECTQQPGSADAGGPAAPIGDASPEATTPTPTPVAPIAATPPSGPPVACADGAAPSAYLWTLTGTLFAFDPRTLETRDLGVVTCPTDRQPWTLSVTTAGTAYLVYDDASLYLLDLTTLDCQPTAYVPGQLGFAGPQGITVGAGRAADRLFVYGDPTSPSLGVSDLSSFTLLQAGTITPAPGAFPVDLKTDAYGRLFALAVDGTLEQIDPATGALLGEDHTGFDVTGREWALMPYDGQLYFFGGESGTLTRYDLAAQALFPLGQVGQTVIGASAASCLSAAALSSSGAPGDLDGGPAQDQDAGDEGDADDASANPATVEPFAAGDSWIGNFECQDGLSTAAIAVESTGGGAIRGRFDYDDARLGSAGSYELTGSFDPVTREARFVPGAWIAKSSPGATAVGMDGYVDLSGTRYAGNMTLPGCGAFSLAR